MEKVLVLKDGPHRLKPLSYWGIAYSQKLVGCRHPRLADRGRSRGAALRGRGRRPER